MERQNKRQVQMIQPRVIIRYLSGTVNWFLR